jgi:GGDEF domain-containing protein
MTGRLNRASGLFAQPMILRLLDHEAAQAKRHHTPIAVLRFVYNLEEGLDAAATRTAQQMLSQILNTQLRAVDLPGHLEDEYLIVLPITTEPGARALAARLVRSVSNLSLPFLTRHVRPSVCVGLSAHPGGEDCDGNVMGDWATAALREAQRQGPNSIVVYADMQDS